MIQKLKLDTARKKEILTCRRLRGQQRKYFKNKLLLGTKKKIADRNMLINLFVYKSLHFPRGDNNNAGTRAALTEVIYWATKLTLTPRFGVEGLSSGYPAAAL